MTTVHACPIEAAGLMPCCGRTPFEVREDRMTADPAAVTCPGRPLTVDLAIPSAADNPGAYLGRLIAYHEHQVLALRRLAAELGIDLPGFLTVWRPWRLEVMPGVHQSVMLPAGARLGYVSSRNHEAVAGEVHGVVLWLEVPLVTDPLDVVTHRYVQLLPEAAHRPPDTGGWLGDVLVYGFGDEPWDGTVFRCYEVEG